MCVYREKIIIAPLYTAGGCAIKLAEQLNLPNIA